jgi:O-antigen/teichoic acid export membrane protein
VLVLTNISRTALNFLYGKERFATVSVTNFIIALCYLAALLALVRLEGLPGWIGAKYLIETAFLLVSLVFVWRHMGRIIGSARLYTGLALEGLSVSLSLLCRTGLDTIPLLIMTYVGASAQDVATFGLCTLLVSAASILPASLNTVLLPKYAQVLKNEPDGTRVIHSRNQKILIIISMIMGILLLSVGFIIENLMAEKFINLTVLLAVLIVLLPLKVLGSLSANILFLKNKTIIGAKIHALALIAAIFLVWIINKEIGIWGAVIGSLIGEMIACCLLLVYSNRELKMK